MGRVHSISSWIGTVIDRTCRNDHSHPPVPSVLEDRVFAAAVDSVLCDSLAPLALAQCRYYTT
jgi:hypothetical protein